MPFLRKQESSIFASPPGGRGRRCLWHRRVRGIWVAQDTWIPAYGRSQACSRSRRDSGNIEFSSFLDSRLRGNDTLGFARLRRNKLLQSAKGITLRDKLGEHFSQMRQRATPPGGKGALSRRSILVRGVVPLKRESRQIQGPVYLDCSFRRNDRSPLHSAKMLGTSE